VTEKPESRLKRRVLEWLRTRGVWAVKIQQRVIRGTPDLLVCWRGRFVAFELKTDDGRIDRLQLHTLDEISKAGGLVDVLRPSDWVEKLEQWEALIEKLTR
jgi:hypothetical protein